MMDAAQVYETYAREFLRGRDLSPVGARVVEQWSRTLRIGATVMELACGGGYPITRVLHAAGLQLWAVDSSATRIAEFRMRFPGIQVQCATVQESDFFGLQYDGAVAIGLIFLLTEQEQTNLISRISGVLRPGARFLFTAPTQTGIWEDLNTGLECKSLGRRHYQDLWERAGFQLVATYADVGQNNYYDVEKIW